jgi:hypothetical protein
MLFYRTGWAPTWSLLTLLERLDIIEPADGAVAAGADVITRETDHELPTRARRTLRGVRGHLAGRELETQRRGQAPTGMSKTSHPPPRSSTSPTTDASRDPRSFPLGRAPTLTASLATADRRCVVSPPTYLIWRRAGRSATTARWTRPPGAPGESWEPHAVGAERSVLPTAGAARAS